MLLIKETKQLYFDDDDLEVTLKGNVFTIDATTIDLCLSAFYWATFRSTKGGIKLHTQLDLKKFMLNQNLYEILQIISLSIFERMTINQPFQQTQLQYFKEQNSNQLNLFDL